MQLGRQFFKGGHRAYLFVRVCTSTRTSRQNYRGKILRSHKLVPGSSALTVTRAGLGLLHVSLTSFFYLSGQGIYEGGICYIGEENVISEQS